MAAESPVRQENPWFEGSEPRPQTRAFVALLRKAADEGLRPSDYRLEAIARALDDGVDPARTSGLLSEALAAYARDLVVPRGDAKVIYIDPELRPAAPGPAKLPVDARLADRLRGLTVTNPLYQSLRKGLAQYRRDWSALPQLKIPAGPPLALGSRGARVALLRERLGVAATAPEKDRYDAALAAAVMRFREVHGLAALPIADAETIAALNRGAAHYEGIIAANMDRVRGLPREGRYLLVDTTSAKLRMIDDGREAGSMKVVVGKAGMETPLLAAYVRYALVNPYWNVPPDLVRKNIAPAVVREGAAALTRKNYVLSADWQSTARVDPAKVDWPAVAAGRKSIWVRQLPGGANMMGAVKFMLPNDYGIYLHDTPDKSLFAREDRHRSSGCVRLEDAPRLAQWLFGRAILAGDASPDRRVDLPQTVPVFITYLTAEVENGAVQFKPDVEGRDTRGAIPAAPIT